MTSKELFIKYCKAVQVLANQSMSEEFRVKIEDIEPMFQSSTHNVEFWGVNLTKIYKDLEVLEIIKRIIHDEDSYIEPGFADGKKFYIDGVTEYQNEEEKKLIEEWLKDEK